MTKKVQRLYEGFAPERYEISLVPDKKTKTFTGSMTITGKKRGRPSMRISLHQKGLNIISASLTKHDKLGETLVEINRINLHSGYDEVRLHATELLYPGQYSLSLQFKGKITNQMNGIYPCFFKENEQPKELIATQFESHYAREVFPCIDEPEAKAVFELTLTTPKKETVISNTPIKKQTQMADSVVTTFEATPRMSTYLLAFVYGDLGYKQAKTKKGTLVRSYATSENVKFTEFSLDVAVKCLEFYEDYFGIDYPLPKCDLIALPDFASGAMENWGCITFREKTMLVDPANSSISTKQYVAMVVAHELAHQWFGNLVTMKWWTDLWLNEGFASWIEYLAVDHIFPDWEMWTQFIAEEQHQALKLDALQHSHPIEVAVRNPEEIHSIFDEISYCKGASVIHMLHDYLGSEPFRDGLRYYLKKHAYGSTDTADLWAALEAVSHKNVKSFMHSWTSSTGYPLLSVEVGDSQIQLSQKQFLLNPTTSPPNSLWPIPLLAETSHMDEIFLSTSSTINIDDPSELKLNRNQSGFYRVLYNFSHQNQLGEMIRNKHLVALDRLGLLSDVFEAAKAGKTDTAAALNFLGFYHEESNAVVWDIIVGNLSGLRSVMDDEALRQAMKPYTRQLVAKQLSRLGWDSSAKDSHFDKMLRPVILGMAAMAEEPAVVEKSLKMFKAMSKPSDIHPDVRGVVYGTTVRHGGAAEFEKLWNMYNKTSSSEDQNMIAAAINSFSQPNLIKKALSLIDSKYVRHQDVGHWVAYSFMNRHAKQTTWKWLVDHWAWLEKNLGSDMSFFRFPIYAARSFSDASFLPVYKQFFATVDNPGLERPIKQGVEIIEWQSAWRKRDLASIKKFFTDNKQA